MEKREKVREHIVIPEANNITFFGIVNIFADVLKNILEDDIVACVFINEQGLIVGSENVFPIENYVIDDGTLFRAFTKKGRWRVSAIRRKNSGSVTLIEFLAPCDTAEKMSEVVAYVLDKTNGTKAVVLEHD